MFYLINFFFEFGSYLFAKIQLFVRVKLKSCEKAYCSYPMSSTCQANVMGSQKNVTSIMGSQNSVTSVMGSQCYGCAPQRQVKIKKKNMPLPGGEIASSAS